MPRSSISGRSSSRRSLDSEDRSGTVHDRTRVARRVHGQPAAGAEGPAGGDHGLRLLRELRGLAVAQPEADRRGVVLSALLGHGGLAGDEHEHAPTFVITKAQLADLPLRLANLLAGGARLALVLDGLGLHHPGPGGMRGPD